jgi:homoserine kinase type II
MADYTRLTLARARDLLAAYDVTPSGLGSIPGGSANSSYLVEAGERTFVLTICDDKAWPEAQALAELIEHLHEAGYPTTELHRTTAGERLAQFDDKPVMLKSFVAGRVSDRLSERAAESVGAALGHLHQLPPTAALPKAHAYGVHSFDGVLGGGFDTAYERWLEARIARCREVASLPLPAGLLHGDAFADNLVFDGDRLLAVLDFEEAFVGPFAFDIGMALAGSAAGRVPPRKHPVALLRGYERVRPIHRDERRSVIAQAAYAATATSVWRYRRLGLELRSADPTWWTMARLADAFDAWS